MASPFGILHLSDLHFKKGSSPDALLGPLREDLDKFPNIPVEFIVISGDLIDRGDANAFQLVEAFLCSLQRSTKLAWDRFVVCPGNHDIEHVPEAFALRERVGPGEELVKKLDDEDAYRVRVLSEYPKRFAGFTALCKSVLRHEFDLPELSRVQTFQDRHIQFVTLNSACRIDKYRPKEASIDRTAFSQAMARADETPGKQPLRIAVWHHAVLGPSSMAESDGYLQRLAQAGFAMLLHGDVHETRAQIVNPYRDALRIAGAGSIGAEDQRGNLYNLIEVSSDQRITVHVREQRTPNGSFDACYAFKEHGKDVAHFSFRPEAAPPDTSRYLAALDETTRWIDFRGLQVGSGKATRFEIERLYVPLQTAGGDLSSKRLDQALSARRTVIQGDAGSGKTTFLRQRTRALLKAGAFPLLIRIQELDQHMEQCWDSKRSDTPTVRTSPHWIRHYLASKEWGLNAAFFESKLRDSRTVLLLDGLDEAANGQRRAWIAQLFVQAAIVYKDCRMVVTTRPAAYRDDAVLAEWETIQIADLDDAGVDEFLKLWSRCLHEGSEDAAAKHQAELRGALDAKPEIRRMARNPLMLTALAVVHWNDKRLPEQRADLYESVLGWLAKARDQRPGRESPESCLRLLGWLALGMQERPGGHRVQLGKDAAAGLIAEEFRTVPPKERLVKARQFLTEEEVDSGIVTSAGADLRFWHRTFQEHLAARTLAGLPDAVQWERLSKEARLYSTEWREVMLLLGGVLHSRGRERLDWLFGRILEAVPAKAGLAELARCFGLMGAMLRDLGAVKYELPAREAERHARMRDAVMAIFTKEGAAKVRYKVRYKDRVAAAEALGQAGDPRLRMPWEAGYWVEIPGGKFRMGRQKTDPRKPNFDRDARDHEPVREVEVATFWMGRYPVTVWEYGHYLEDTGAPPPEDWENQQEHPNRPVTTVNWHEAQAYCDWVSTIQAGCRLPEEKEWEYAVRGTDGRKYPWGNEEPDAERVNSRGNVGAPSPVGVFPGSHAREELADMAGNVWEWTSGRYGEDHYVARGGSWGSDHDGAACAARYDLHPGSRGYVIGFRCARTNLPF